MYRRSFLALLPGIFFPSIILPKKTIRDFGWIATNRYHDKTLYDISLLRDYGVDKVACLWKAYTAVRKQQWIPHQQVGGDCVAHGTGSSVDILSCCRISLQRKAEKYINDSSTNLIYSGGRNLINKKRYRGAGMEGSWGVKYLAEYGNLLRAEYPPYDLRPYTRETLNYWDRAGVPTALQEKAKEHPLLNYIPVKSFSEIRDSVCSGHPVVFCSYLGANNDQRDADGFIEPSGRWAHAWMIAGVQDGRRPGVCLMNSHGPSFGKGPKTFNQPDGSVWMDAEYIDRSLNQFSDSYALTDYRGFVAPEKKYVIW